MVEIQFAYIYYHKNSHLQKFTQLHIFLRTANNPVKKITLQNLQLGMLMKLRHLTLLYKQRALGYLLPGAFHPIVTSLFGDQN